MYIYTTALLQRQRHAHTPLSLDWQIRVTFDLVCYHYYVNWHSALYIDIFKDKMNIVLVSTDKSWKRKRKKFSKTDKYENKIEDKYNINEKNK